MHAFGEHYVTIDFTGWRYFEIPLRERDADKHRDYAWPYASLSGIYMSPVNTSHISEVNLYLNNVPPNDTARVCLSPIKALRTSRVKLANPVVDLNGQQLVLPTTLESGDYVELTSGDDCRVYDERGTLLERITLQDKMPVLKAGENQIAFRGDASPGFAARAGVTVIAHGKPLTERSPKKEINWTLLRDEYDLPRGVTKLDGKENAWETICRKDAKSLPCGVEIDVEQVNASDAAYNSPGAVTLESFDNQGFVADSPDSGAAKVVYDAKQKSVAVKPGVTQALQPQHRPGEDRQGELAVHGDKHARRQQWVVGVWTAFPETARSVEVPGNRLLALWRRQGRGVQTAVSRHGWRLD